MDIHTLMNRKNDIGRNYLFLHTALNLFFFDFLQIFLGVSFFIFFIKYFHDYFFKPALPATPTASFSIKRFFLLTTSRAFRSLASTTSTLDKFLVTRTTVSPIFLSITNSNRPCLDWNKLDILLITLDISLVFQLSKQ